MYIMKNLFCLLLLPFLFLSCSDDNEESNLDKLPVRFKHTNNSTGEISYDENKRIARIVNTHSGYGLDYSGKKKEVREYDFTYNQAGSLEKATLTHTVYRDGVIDNSASSSYTWEFEQVDENTIRRDNELLILNDKRQLVEIRNVYQSVETITTKYSYDDSGNLTRFENIFMGTVEEHEYDDNPGLAKNIQNNQWEKMYIAYAILYDGITPSGLLYYFVNNVLLTKITSEIFIEGEFPHAYTYDKDGMPLRERYVNIMTGTTVEYYRTIEYK